MRLGQRHSGGVAECLKTSGQSRDSDALGLHIGRRDAALRGETVEPRLKVPASEVGLRPEMGAA